MTVQDRIIAIIAAEAVLDPSEITPDSTLAELGIDSLGLVESIFAIEEAFDVTIPFNTDEPVAERLEGSTIADVVRGVEELIAARG